MGLVALNVAMKLLLALLLLFLSQTLYAAGQSQLRSFPPLPKVVPYSCSPQYLDDQISKAKAARENLELVDDSGR